MTKEQQIEFNQRIEESAALTAKLQAETAKINTENRYYSVVLAASATLAIVAVVKLFL